MYLVMWTHVRDYDVWKAVFDSGERVRREYLCSGHEIYRDVDDPNQLTLFLEFPSKGRAEAFLDDPGLKEKMRESGVDSEPQTMFVNQTQQTDYRSRHQAA